LARADGAHRHRVAARQYRAHDDARLPAIAAADAWWVSKKTEDVHCTGLVCCIERGGGRVGKLPDRRGNARLTGPALVRLVAGLWQIP
jgi:hypothetical protein